MSDKVQLIKEEIERRIVQAEEFAERAEGANDDSSKLSWDFVATQNKSLLQFIDSLPEEHNEDLEEEIDRYYSDWQFDNDTIYEDMRDICRHFAGWQKRQLMIDACDTKITTDGGSSFPMIKYQLPLTYDCKIGDKVKLIIIKED